MLYIINKFLAKRNHFEGQTTISVSNGTAYLYHRDYHTGVNYEVASIDSNDKLTLNKVNHAYINDLQILVNIEHSYKVNAV